MTNHDMIQGATLNSSNDFPIQLTLLLFTLLNLLASAELKTITSFLTHNIV